MTSSAWLRLLMGGVTESKSVLKALHYTAHRALNLPGGPRETPPDGVARPRSSPDCWRAPAHKKPSGAQLAPCLVRRTPQPSRQRHRRRYAHHRRAHSVRCSALLRRAALERALAPLASSSRRSAPNRPVKTLEAKPPPRGGGAQSIPRRTMGAHLALARSLIAPPAPPRTWPAPERQLRNRAEGRRAAAKKCAELQGCPSLALYRSVVSFAPCVANCFRAQRAMPTN
jgi:hypothetical protein